jgi:TetR/AcrR family transcriptional regulator
VSCTVTVMAVRAARVETVRAVLDAAESLLVEDGHRAVTTRRLAERAAVNHGLIHYYFGSIEEVLLQTLERVTARLTTRQREMYAADVPFIEKWRTAMDYLTADFDSGYEKIWFELQALAWNNATVRTRVAAVFAEWQSILMPAFDAGLDELRIDKARWPTEAMVSLVMTFNEGITVERLSGFDSGHRSLLALVDELLEDANERVIET